MFLLRKRKKIFVYFHIGGLGDTILDMYSLNKLVKYKKNINVYYVFNANFKDIIELSRVNDLIKKVPITYISSRRNMLEKILYFLRNIINLIKLPIFPNYLVIGSGMNVKRIDKLVSIYFPKKKGASIPDYPLSCIKKIFPVKRRYDVLIGPIEGKHRVFLEAEVLKKIGFLNHEKDKLFESKIFNKIKIKNYLDYDFENEFLVLHNGSSSKNSPKKIPNNCIEEFLNLFNDRFDLNLLFIGGSNEQEYMKMLKKKFLFKEKLFIIDKVIPLKILSKILSKAKLVIGPDSGIGHLAAFVGTKTLSIFGPTKFTQCCPFNKKGFILYHPVGCSPCYWTNNFYNCPFGKICMENISPYSILYAIDLILKNKLKEKIIFENGNILIPNKLII